MDKTAFPVPNKDLTGSVGQDEATLPMTKQGFKNPGPTDRLRGVEANTDESKGTPLKSVLGATPIEYGDPNEAPMGCHSYGEE